MHAGVDAVVTVTVESHASHKNVLPAADTARFRVRAYGRVVAALRGASSACLTRSVGETGVASWQTGCSSWLRALSPCTRTLRRARVRDRRMRTCAQDLKGIVQLRASKAGRARHRLKARVSSADTWAVPCQGVSVGAGPTSGVPHASERAGGASRMSGRVARSRSLCAQVLRLCLGPASLFKADTGAEKSLAPCVASLWLTLMRRVRERAGGR